MGALLINSPKSAGLVRGGGRDVYNVSPPRIARLRGLCASPKPRRLTEEDFLSLGHLYRTSYPALWQFLGSGGRIPPARRVVNRLLDRKAIIHLPRVRDPPQDCNVWVPNIRRRSSRVVGWRNDPSSGIQRGTLCAG